MKFLFFSGSEYISVTRDVTGAGTVDPGFPRPISDWGWGDFGKSGIDAALYSGTKCYFFSGNRYIRVSRGDSGAGPMDSGYPAPISNWGWGEFGKNGIDAALYSGPKCYFFSGGQYIRVTRGDTGPGTMDPGYPSSLSNWGWGEFGAGPVNTHLTAAARAPIVGVPPLQKLGIDGALFSGSKCYFFDGDQYIRVTRGQTGAGTIDPGYPAPISRWGWGGFGSSGISDGLYNTGAPVKKPATPTGLRVVQVSLGAISLAWNPEAQVDDFILQLAGRKSGQPDDNRTLLVQGSTPTAAATGLRPAYTYAVTVAATNAAGQSAPSASVSATTPDQPVRTIVVSRSGTGADTMMTVTGSGFTGGRVIVIRVTDQQLDQIQFIPPPTAASNGTFTATNPVPCSSGFQLTVTAFEDADPVHTQATPVMTSCP